MCWPVGLRRLPRWFVAVAINTGAHDLKISIVGADCCL